ncbi:MAG: biotin/lipoyl-binding protein [Candidatus Sulfotelmatobacter sp.]
MSANPIPDLPTDDAQLPRPGMSRTQKFLFFVTAWLICLMPFLFWWNTWFGRKLSDQQLNQYLHDTKKPRHIQQALVQVGERITRQDATAKQWYPELVRLATDPVEEVRNTDAWVMGQDTSGAGFHEALLKMLADPSPTVRGNAALSLVRFGDASGRPQILALLQSAEVRVPASGPIGPTDSWSDPGRSAQVVDTAAVGTTIREGGVVAKISTAAFTDGTGIFELRSPINGRLRTLSAQRGKTVHPGDVIAIIDPGTEPVWEALRALYLIGQPDDLPAIRPYQRDLPDISNDVRQQAVETEQAIRSRDRR